MQTMLAAPIRQEVMEMAHNNRCRAVCSASAFKPAKYRGNPFIIHDKTNQIIDELSP